MAQQLFKNRSKGMFLGVCAGLSDVLGIDVTILRLLTVVGTIMTGSLILWIYLLLGVMLPNKSEE